jgi:hypothetical protein
MQGLFNADILRLLVKTVASSSPESEDEWRSIIRIVVLIDQKSLANGGINLY